MGRKGGSDLFDPGRRNKLMEQARPGEKEQGSGGGMKRWDDGPG